MRQNIARRRTMNAVAMIDKLADELVEQGEEFARARISKGL